MVTPDGRVKVLDFGVAQRGSWPRPSRTIPTRTGELPELTSGVVGTVPYAAPEQLTGRAVDGRADLFSVGVMLYELACGRRPFGGANAAQFLEDVLTRGRPRLSRSAARSADAGARAARPAAARARSRTTARLVRRGARLADVGARRRAAGGRGADDIRTIVIAGFVNISGNADDDWLGTGMTETLTADAAQLEAVSIVPRERVAERLKTLGQQTGEPEDRLFLRAARELRARWVVIGGFQRSMDAVRVTASISDVASGQIVRTTKVDGSVNAIFELQDRLVRELASSLRAAISPASTPVILPASTLPETEVISAYEAFSRGLINRRAEGFEALDRAVTLFERAVTLDPAYARAHIELGAAYGAKAEYLSMPELNARSIASLRRAIELQPGSARAWRELGATLMAVGEDVEGMAALRRALALDPDEASGYGSMGRALFIGYARFREAAEWFDRAIEKNANAGWYALQLAHCSALLRDFPRGKRAAARATALQEAFLSGRQGLSIAGGYIRAGHLAALEGRHAEAVELFRRELDFLVRTDHPLRHRTLVELNARLGAAYLNLGDEQRAQNVFDVALEGFERRVRLGADDPFTRYYAASVHALRGDAEPALAFLERAMAQLPAFTAARALIEPEFDSLRGDVRFQRLMVRIAPSG